LYILKLSAFFLKPDTTSSIFWENIAKPGVYCAYFTRAFESANNAFLNEKICYDARFPGTD